MLYLSWYISVTVHLITLFHSYSLARWTNSVLLKEQFSFFYIDASLDVGTYLSL